jgi:hypothetical protein
MPAALQANELGNIFQVLAKYKLVPLRQHRHGANAQFTQPLQRRWIVQDIERDEVDAFFRKKLFRSKTTASAGLSEKYQFSVDVFHNLMGDGLVQPTAQVSTDDGAVNPRAALR